MHKKDDDLMNVRGTGTKAELRPMFDMTFSGKK